MFEPPPKDGASPKRKRVVSRRSLLALGASASTAALAGAVPHHDGALGGPSQTIRGSMPWREGAADAPSDSVGGGYRFLTPAEHAFVAAAADRFIPPDPTGPSGVEAGVPSFIDRQLAGEFGKGQHLYLGGPWPKGTPAQGYQSRFTPAELYRRAIAAIDRVVGDRNKGKVFKDLGPHEQDAVLKSLESGTLDLGEVDAKTFFDVLWGNVKEGYFADPIYGGNRDMAAWKMIGFPGAHYDYSDWVKRHGQAVPFPPVSLVGRPGWSQA